MFPDREDEMKKPKIKPRIMWAVCVRGVPGVAYPTIEMARYVRARYETIQCGKWTPAPPKRRKKK